MPSLPKPGTPYRRRPLWYLMIIPAFERMNDFLRSEAVPDEDYEDLAALYPRAKAFVYLWENRNKDAGVTYDEQP
jgi:hypothetical protein